MSSPENRLQLIDIYESVGAMFFPHGDRKGGRAWMNNVRHHLSVNDCFIKVDGGRRTRGSFWAIHPACVDDFRRGDFRRRRWMPRGGPRSRPERVDVSERYETMQQTVSHSDELFAYLVSSDVFAKLYTCFDPTRLL